jgi:hypothetical protein
MMNMTANAEINSEANVVEKELEAVVSAKDGPSETAGNNWLHLLSIIARSTGL